MKSHMGFWLVPTSMTLNDLERRNSPYFAFFSPNSIALQADYVTVAEDKTYNVRKINSPNSSLSLLAQTNAPCDTWATCKSLLLILFVYCVRKRYTNVSISRSLLHVVQRKRSAVGLVDGEADVNEWGARRAAN